MPYTTIRAFVTVSSKHAKEVHEILDQAIDRIAIQNIHVTDSEITEECADPPEDAEE